MLLHLLYCSSDDGGVDDDDGSDDGCSDDDDDDDDDDEGAADNDASETVMPINLARMTNSRRALRSILSATPSAASARCTSFLAARRFSLAARSASRSAYRSSSVGIGGRLSIGTPDPGAMMCLTTCRLCLDTRQPGVMATTSPVRSELLGSWTR